MNGDISDYKPSHAGKRKLFKGGAESQGEIFPSPTAVLHDVTSPGRGAAELLPAGDPLGCSLAVLFSVHLRGRVICTFLERPCLLICLKYRQIGHAFLPFWSTFMLKQRIQMTCQ